MAYNAVMLRTLHRAPAHLCEPLRKMWGQVETLPPWCPLVVARVWWISLIAVAAGTQQSWLLDTGTLNLLSRTFSGIKAQRRHLWVCKRSLSMFSVHTNCLVLVFIVAWVNQLDYTLRCGWWMLALVPLVRHGCWPAALEVVVRGGMSFFIMWWGLCWVSGRSQGLRVWWWPLTGSATHGVGSIITSTLGCESYVWASLFPWLG